MVLVVLSSTSAVFVLTSTGSLQGTEDDMWVLDVGIPFNEETDGFAIATNIEQTVLRRYANSAGTGFGYRDLQFEFDHKADARDVETAIRLYLKAIKMPVMKNDDRINDHLDKAYIGCYQEVLLP